MAMDRYADRTGGMIAFAQGTGRGHRQRLAARGAEATGLGTHRIFGKGLIDDLPAEGRGLACRLADFAHGPAVTSSVVTVAVRFGRLDGGVGRAGRTGSPGPGGQLTGVGRDRVLPTGGPTVDLPSRRGATGANGHRPRKRARGTARGMSRHAVIPRAGRKVPVNAINPVDPWTRRKESHRCAQASDPQKAWLAARADAPTGLTEGPAGTTPAEVRCPPDRATPAVAARVVTGGGHRAQ